MEEAVAGSSEKVMVVWPAERSSGDGESSWYILEVGLRELVTD